MFLIFINMKKFIKKLLRETLLSEAEIDRHTLDRIKGRIKVMSDDDLPAQYRERIMYNFNRLEKLDFPLDKSYAVLLGNFTPNPASEHSYKDPKNGEMYYRIISDPVLKDSTGNQFWVIIRNNTVKTFMLRKDWQTKPNTLNAEKLRVDFSIENLDVIKQNNDPNVNTSKQSSSKSKSIVVINGIKWVVNSNDETIFKKNKPTEKHKIEDMLKQVDKPTQDKILSLL
jgi:hypothetical protein